MFPKGFVNFQNLPQSVIDLANQQVAGRTLCVSFSGGRTSAFMCCILEANRDRFNFDIEYIFANTGMEREETLIFVNNVDQHILSGRLHWVEGWVDPQMGIGVQPKQCSFETAKRPHEYGPMDALIEKFDIPGTDASMCTKELKTRTIRYYWRDLFAMGYADFCQAIGIRIDEPKRVRAEIYPMVNWFPTHKIQVRSFWAQMPFDLGLKDYEGNCTFCFKKSLRNRITLIREHPEMVDKWERRESGSEQIFDRDGHRIPELRQMAKNKSIKSVTDSFDHQSPGFDVELDTGFSCTCGS